MENYTLHYRQSEFPLIFTELTQDPKCYGEFDYYILQEKDNVAAFLSGKGLKEASDLGKKLLNKNYANKVLKGLRQVNRKIKNTRLIDNLEECDRKKLLDIWKKLEKISFEMMFFYRYCDHTVLAPLEEIIFKAAGDRDKFADVFKHPSNAEKLKFDSRQKAILRLLHQIGKLKFSIHANFSPWFNSIYKFAKIIAKNNDISADQVLVLKCEEIRSALSGNGVPPKTVLNERLKGCIFLPPPKGQKWEFHTGEKFKKWKKILEPTDVKEIPGTIAYQGKSVGKVKIHLSWTRGQKIPKGSVLVCGMTNPQIVPFLKNVVAIVTDEGGLTCHAAIVSRELKIPCIVGAKVATKVLKDGDLVEVDANKGIVKILKKNEKK